MTPDRLRECRSLLGWSANHLAGRLGINERTVRRMEAGTAQIPAPLADWLERRSAALLADWLPDAWASRPRRQRRAKS